MRLQAILNHQHHRQVCSKHYCCCCPPFQWCSIGTDLLTCNGDSCPQVKELRARLLRQCVAGQVAWCGGCFEGAPQHWWTRCEADIVACCTCSAAGAMPPVPAAGVSTFITPSPGLLRVMPAICCSAGAGCADTNPVEVFNEAEKLASLRHPCVMGFYGVVTDPGSLRHCGRGTSAMAL